MLDAIPYLADSRHRASRLLIFCLKKRPFYEIKETSSLLCPIKRTNEPVLTTHLNYHRFIIDKLLSL